MQDNITAAQVWAAYKPLLDLLGVTPFDVYDGHAPVPSVDEDGFLAIRYLKVIEPDAPREDWPTVEVGDSVKELAYEVTIYPTGLNDPHEVWTDAQIPTGTRVPRADPPTCLCDRNVGVIT